MSKRRVVVWLRNDLRLTDSSPFSRAAALAKSSPTTEVLPVYCFDPRTYGLTNQVFLGKGFGAPKTAHHRAKFVLESVLDLKSRLRAIGSDLLILIGEPEKMLPAVLGGAAPGAAGQSSPLVVASAEVCYEERAVERAVSSAIRACGGAKLDLLWGHSLYEMEDVLEQFGPGLERMPDGFTPFKNAVERNCALREPLPAPSMGQLPLPADRTGLEFDFSPTLPELPWEPSVAREGQSPVAQSAQEPNAFPWAGGETSGLARVEHYFFKTSAVAEYFGTRNGMLGTEYSTKFAPWLACGALSPRHIQSRLTEFERTVTENKSTYWVRFELTWRDFFWFFALKHGSKIFQPSGLQRSAPQWREDEEALTRWKQGNTGMPLVDANMRELAATGWMSNRGRQNVASYLILDLGIDWRRGADHFESLLLDYDTASNWGNWVAAAGLTGGRVNKFNITKQSRDYDANGDYLRAWLPELARVPTEHIHFPSNMPAAVQQQAGCVIGRDYPAPIKTAGGHGGGGRGNGGGRGGGRGGGGHRKGGSRPAARDEQRDKAKQARRDGRQRKSRVAGGWTGDA